MLATKTATRCRDSDKLGNSPICRKCDKNCDKLGKSPMCRRDDDKVYYYVIYIHAVAVALLAHHVASQRCVGFKGPNTHCADAHDK